MKIAVVGAGLMGLAAAHRLVEAGHEVTVIEHAEQVGGLSTWQDFGGFTWDRFYHVILPSDGPLLRFIDRIGLARELIWTESRTGYYVDRRFHGLSNTMEFVRFPPLSLWSKARLALTIMIGARITDWRRLEQIPLEQWLLRHSGRATFEKFWKPVLLAKLGEHYKRTSAVFIWSYIKRLYSARDASAKKEHLGHVRGGYRTVLERVVALIEARGGRVRLRTGVEAATPRAGGGVDLRMGSRVEGFDKVVFTGPVSALRQVAGADLVEVPAGGRDVEYLGVVCMVLLTRQPLTPYYVVNIADEQVPFTGVIGMSTLVDTAETGGLYMTYLPKYVLSTDPLLTDSDDAIRERFLAGLRHMFPDFPCDAIVRSQIHRAPKVQPLQVLGYSELVPRPVSRHEDFFVLNSAQFVNNTLNNNEVVRCVDAFFEQHGARLGTGAAAAA